LWKTVGVKAVHAAIIALLLAVSLRADSPLIVVAPAAPGGGWDQTARALQHVWATIDHTVNVQVENVAGAAGTIGLARFVASERGNPNALLVTGLVMVSGITANRSPVSLAQTTPIARLTGEYEVIVVPAASPFHTLADLLSGFTTSPTSVSWGGGSAGGTDDLLIRLLAEAVRVSPTRVNYIAFPGGGAALAALLGGQVTAGVSGYGEFAGQIEAGTLRLLAVSAPQRVDGIDAPTLREQGIDLDLSNWRGVVAPPGLTDVERDRLTERVTHLASSPEWRTILARNGWQDMLLTGPAFRQFLLAEQHRVDHVLERLRTDATHGRDVGKAGERGDARWLTVTPMTGPIVVVTLLALLIARLRSFELRRGSPDSAASQLRRGSPTEPPRDRGTRRALVLVGVLGVHALVFPLVGFIPASTALFAITTSLFGSRHWQRDMAIGLATAVVLYVVFTVGLGLALPSDPITRWLRR